MRGRSRSSRRGVRGGDWRKDERIGYDVGGSGVRGRSRSRGRRSVRRGGKFMAFGGDLNAREIYALGGSGVRGRSRGRSVRRSRGGQYPFDDQGRAFMALGGSGVRSRGRGRGRRGGGVS